jgi:predicted Zn-dependent protease
VTVYNPATGRKETLLIDTESEVALGKDIDKQMPQKVKILNDYALQQRLEGIGKRVATVSDRQDLAYYFRVVDDKELNAFAVPGGFIYVNSGLINASTDDELACVVAHEIGHVAARHSVKQAQSAMGYQLLMGIALGISGQQQIAQATDIVYNLISLGYSREDELLADMLSVRYAKRANFNPYGTVTFLEKLKREVAEKGANLRIEFLSSHPDLDARIAKVKEEIARQP